MTLADNITDTRLLDKKGDIIQRWNEFARGWCYAFNLIFH